MKQVTYHLIPCDGAYVFRSFDGGNVSDPFITKNDGLMLLVCKVAGDVQNPRIPYENYAKLLTDLLKLKIPTYQYSKSERDIFDFEKNVHYSVHILQVPALIYAAKKTKVPVFHICDIVPEKGGYFITKKGILNEPFYTKSEAREAAYQLKDERDFHKKQLIKLLSEIDASKLPERVGEFISGKTFPQFKFGTN